MKEIKATLIKPKKKKEKQMKDREYLGPLLMLLLGIILFTNSSKAIIYVFYAIGACIFLFGVYHLLSYYRLKKKLTLEDNQKMVLGTSSIFIGILIILLASAIETFLRFILGFILLLNGLKKIWFSFYQRNYIVLLEGIIFIGIGLYTILAENIVLQIIGILLIISSVIDFFSYLLIKKNKA